MIHLSKKRSLKPKDTQLHKDTIQDGLTQREGKAQQEHSYEACNENKVLSYSRLFILNHYFRAMLHNVFLPLWMTILGERTQLETSQMQITVYWANDS